VTGVTVEDPDIRDFAATLMELDKGKLHKDCSEGLWDLIRSCEELKKTGSLTLTIMMKPMDTSDGSPMVMYGEVKLKLPVPPSSPTVMYVDEQGNLSRNNPYQPELEGLRVITEEHRNTRSI
jgi:hypothetical protein